MEILLLVLDQELQEEQVLGVMLELGIMRQDMLMVLEIFI